MKVTDRLGRPWRVNRRWLPWRRRIRRSPDLDWDIPFDGPDDLAGILIAVVLVVVAVVVLPVLLLAIGIILELALLLALVPLVLLFRLLFRLPWTLEVKNPDRVVVHVEKVAGWSESQQRITELGEYLRGYEGLLNGPIVPADRPTGSDARPPGAPRTP